MSILCNPHAFGGGGCFYFLLIVVYKGAPKRGFLIKELIGPSRVKHMSKIGEYLQETKGELKHVSWPTKNQAILFTVVVVVFSIATAIFLGAFDYLFTMGVKLFI